jgi:hypothetical protein
LQDALKEYEKAVQWLPAMIQTVIARARSISSEGIEAYARGEHEPGTDRTISVHRTRRQRRHGVLYRGIDPVLDREVAIKVMLVDFSDDTEQMRPRFTGKRRRRRSCSIRTSSRFEFAEEITLRRIVMEFLRGTPLDARCLLRFRSRSTTN